MFQEESEKCNREKKVVSRKKEANVTGIPDGIKEQAERKSGLSLDHVRVHRNSHKPQKLGALAFAQGSNIYLGSGQDKHLAHELGHVVQQMENRVPVTSSINGMPLNDNAALEREADNFLN